MFVMSHLEKQQSAAAAAAAAASTAVAGKTARPCDGCARWRARWYCAADDAFLCQSCDSSVHSANPLARRHHRLRIKGSSSSGGPDVDDDGPGVPSWLRGFKRKARTPRPHQHLKTVSAAKKARPTKVPELVEASVDETEDDEQQLLYCVPVFDPALVEFRSPPSLHDSNATCSGDEAKLTLELSESTPESTSTIDTANRLASLLPLDMELAEFAVNMESLLGSGLDGSDDSFSMEKLGLVHSMEDNDNNVSYCLDNADGRLKTEQLEDAEHCCPIDLDLDMTRERLELDFNFPGSSTAEEDDLDEEKTDLTRDQQEEATKQAKLRLNYEAVISAWSSHGSSPWTGGERPQINLDNFTWTDYMVMWAEGVGEGGVVLGARHGGNTGGGHADVGRRARVTRYREKRRTRLFAKKIRYEVRKLNAEKRPRMKGRFVKRAPGLLH